MVALLAFLTAVSVDGMARTEDYVTGLDVVANVVKLDMKKWWKPTAAGYFSHVSRQRIQDVLAAAVSPQIALNVANLKKAEAADYAETQLEGRDWLPKLLGGEL